MDELRHLSLSNLKVLTWKDIPLSICLNTYSTISEADEIESSTSSGAICSSVDPSFKIYISKQVNMRVLLQFRKLSSFLFQFKVF